MSPLDNLQPPLLPPAIPWWPPAPGWWALALLAGVSLATFCWLHWRRPRRRAEPPAPAPLALDPLRVAALEELAQLRKPYDLPAGPWLQQLNALLKRLCRAHYPDSRSHTLSGRAWLAYLDSRCPAAGLTRWMILVEGGYRAECRLDDKAIDGLYQSVDIWIRRHV
ncbi:protein of unknown function [Azotobacter beijerinckii]|uniref:DUF4381 domain-containing protein n=1 Tax=Azotobacter beijerinckii TaxID=170623 RepID=A0A1H9MK98_9GAMM|nr:DUF4381 domain-containing protein [Azotobacter beijerinckii]SER24122.1 protein of unknown function [Azotobacter beijerinckii]